jgi:hypothetical protein
MSANVSATAPATLGPGGTVPKKRALFGLLDADGWAWAGVKSAVWLVIIILMLGYIPDRAYYLTVNRTVDLGVLAWSPVNFCPGDNGALPCPAPVGAIVPWEESPAELALPAPRTDGAAIQVGTSLLYIGGTDGVSASADVSVAALANGNFGPWGSGPALPAPRADATVISASGVIYVIGGYDETGAPTTTVYSLSPDTQTGSLGEWTAVDSLTLPAPLAGAAGAAAPTGLLVIGGEGPDGPVTTTLHSQFHPTSGVPQAWLQDAALATPQVDANAAVIGDYVWLWGGHDASGPIGTVQRGTIGLAAPRGFPENETEGRVEQWNTKTEINLPAARDDAAGWAANGAIYSVGGADAAGPQREVFWATPPSDGETLEWKHLEQSDLPVGASGGSVVISGPNAIVVGGEAADGVLRSSVRANTAPQSPFFQVGLVGATVPGLKIDGEIGQQLGYLNAAGAGTVNFVILLLVGWAFAHREQSTALLRRLLRR